VLGLQREGLMIRSIDEAPRDARAAFSFADPPRLGN
jgi:hypothetical protein